jgi:hypothetical protein
MSILDWARGIKPDLVQLQARTRIPAFFAAAQFCQESASGGGLSELAQLHHNCAGLKWAEWQREHGCEPVSYDTWEVIGGQRVDIKTDFCSCPNLEVWLQVYADLLTGQFYGPALAYAADPMLYAAHVWQRGWATDPAYLTGISTWMAQLWPDYMDTLSTTPPATGRPVAILDAAGRRLCEGWFQDPDGTGPEPDRVVVRVRELAEGQGQAVDFDPGGPAVYLRWPGTSNNK